MISCTENDLEFFRSLKDDSHTVEYGWNYVSTRGGGTSTTEFEYLTGNSMAYTNGINPYSSFDFTNVPSMVSLLKEQGYHYLLGTAHPDNVASVNTFLKLQYEQVMTKEKYGGMKRSIFCKEI